MLRNITIRKLSVASFTLLIVLTLYLFPSKNNKELDIKMDKVEYIYPDNLESIYLLDSNNYIARTTILSNCNSTIDKVRDLLEGLIIGGKKSNIIPNGFRSIIPSDTTINDIKLNNKTIEIDFSKELLDIKKEYEELMIESIIYTLTSLNEIDNVIIKVNGKKLEYLPKNKIYLPDILDRNYGINKDYKLVNINNIDSYTVYYVNSYNDNYYYVPVTRYINNNKKDKIKVIIEELSSSPVNESNLMSFLNVSTKLLNYEIDDDKLKLNFNEMIFNDISTKNILEEVIYTVGLSMIDNLNVKEVKFLVNNKEIYNFPEKIV